MKLKSKKPNQQMFRRTEQLPKEIVQMVKKQWTQCSTSSVTRNTSQN